jgi:hypothetical protein
MRHSRDSSIQTNRNVNTVGHESKRLDRYNSERCIDRQPNGE